MGRGLGATQRRLVAAVAEHDGWIALPGPAIVGRSRYQALYRAAQTLASREMIALSWRANGGRGYRWGLAVARAGTPERPRGAFGFTLRQTAQVLGVSKDTVRRALAGAPAENAPHSTDTPGA